jgi:hypothetical protein
MMHRLTVAVMIAALTLGSTMACARNTEPAGPTPDTLVRFSATRPGMATACS